MQDEKKKEKKESEKFRNARQAPRQNGERAAAGSCGLSGFG